MADNSQTTIPERELASDYLVRVAAPHFVAGLIMASTTPEDTCTRAAPILSWAVGKRRSELRRYFNDKGWTATIEKV